MNSKPNTSTANKIILRRACNSCLLLNICNSRGIRLGTRNSSCLHLLDIHNNSNLLPNTFGNRNPHLPDTPRQVLLVPLKTSPRPLDRTSLVNSKGRFPEERGTRPVIQVVSFCMCGDIMPTIWNISSATAAATATTAATATAAATAAAILNTSYRDPWGLSGLP